MSGVIDSDGVQWEHCNGCKGEDTPDFSERGKWVRIDELRYEPPSEQHPHGRDLCPDCAEGKVTESGIGAIIVLPPKEA